MLSVRIVYDIEGWAYYHQTMALIRYCPPDIKVSSVSVLTPDGGYRKPCDIVGPEPVDVFLVLDYDIVTVLNNELIKRKQQSKILSVWSNGWPYHTSRFAEVHSISSHTIVNNQAAWTGFGRSPDTTYIRNGVELATFSVTRPLDCRSTKVVWLGSELHRRTKCYDELIQPLGRLLVENDIECDFVLVDSFGRNKRTPQQMADWYNTATVYVCASESEGTPNTALEAAACGCTLVSTRVGNMEELISDGENGKLVDRDLQSIMRGVEEAILNYEVFAEAMQESISGWDYRHQIAEYYELVRNLVGQGLSVTSSSSR